MEAEIIKLGDDRSEFVTPSTSFTFYASTWAVIFKDTSKIHEKVKRTTRKRYGLVAEMEKFSLFGSIKIRAVYTCV